MTEQREPSRPGQGPRGPGLETDESRPIIDVCVRCAPQVARIVDERATALAELKNARERILRRQTMLGLMQDWYTEACTTLRRHGLPVPRADPTVEVGQRVGVKAFQEQGETQAAEAED